MTDDARPGKPVIFTRHARERMQERGAAEDDVLAALRLGQPEPTQRCGVQQIVPVVDEEAERIVVVTVYTFYFQEGESP